MPIQIPHSKPTLDAFDVAAVTKVLQSSQLAQGNQVLAFEKKLSQYIGVKSAVAVNSGTSALHLALLALKVGPGDEVIVPSFVCTALLNAIAYTGAWPRIADVNSDDFNICPIDVKKKITKRTKAIIVPHIFGCPADMKALLRLGVPIIEDCAQSIGAAYGDKKAGSLGVLSICSFYATKMMTTTEGGMVLSNQPKLLDTVRDLREYDNALTFKVRYNYKMTDVQAALGLSQLARLNGFIKQRQAIAKVYDKAVANTGMVSPDQPVGRRHVYYRYVLKVNKGQKALLQRLTDKGILAAAPVFKPLHRYVGVDQCPVTDQLMTQCLSIPIYPSLTQPQVQYVIKNLNS